MAWMILSVLTLSALQVVYWLTIDATSPVTVTGPTRLMDARGEPLGAFRAGDIMEVARTFCRTRYESGEVQARWEDGVIYSVPATPTRSDLGCGTRIYLVPVPNIPAGQYTYRVTAEYRNNPLVTTRVEFPPVPVTVLP